MIYSKEVDNMCVVAKGPNHGPAPIPEEGKWIYAKEIKDISGYTHGVGWCAPQQGVVNLLVEGNKFKLKSVAFYFLGINNCHPLVGCKLLHLYGLGGFPVTEHLAVAHDGETLCGSQLGSLGLDDDGL